MCNEKNEERRLKGMCEEHEQHENHENHGNHEHHEHHKHHGRHGHHGGHFHGEDRRGHEHGRFTVDMENLQDDTIVCRCKKVSYGDLKKAVAEGAGTYEEVQEATGCGIGCEHCVDALKKMVEDLVKAC